MDGSMEAGPSRSDAKTDSPPIDVSIEKESKETRMKPLEKARAKLAQTKQMNIKLAENCNKLALNIMDESME
uniref:Uncharacterized protein n=2 Tax=Bursaphelenchus xylophilus TaxID=6326 RepID=A0A1I7SP24_BURXY